LNTQFTFSSAPTPYPDTNYKLEKKERKKRNTKQLKEIQGRKGQGPIDYSDLLRHFTVQINFMDLAQMSPDFAKNVRSLITRVNEKKPKSKKTSDYMPPTVEEGEEEEEEILTTEVTIESNMTNINLQSYATTNSIANTTANSTDLPVSRELSHDCENPRIEPIHPKTPSKLVAKSKPLISQPLPVSPENNSLIPANEALQLKANLVNLHGGVPYKSLGGEKAYYFYAK
jgi:hypothetical protein